MRALLFAGALAFALPAQADVPAPAPVAQAEHAEPEHAAEHAAPEHAAEHAAPEHAAPAELPHPVYHEDEDEGAAEHKADHEGVAAPHEGATAGHHAAGAEHGEGHHGDHHAGIVNWWSFDYGANAKDPAHKGWPPPFGFALVNFIVFALIMKKLAWAPLKSFVLERHEGIKRELTEAAKLRAEAEAKLKLYEAKLLGLESEIEQLLAGIRQEAEAERARMIAAGEEQSKRIKLEADRQIGVEIERARRMLKERAIELAMTAAEALVKKQLTPEDQSRIAARYADALEAQPVSPRKSAS